MVLKKTHREELREKYGEEGKHMAFDKLVIAEGGIDNPSALQRATNYAK